MPGTVNAMCEHGAIAVSLFISFRILVQEKSFFFERHRWIKLHAVCTVDTFSLTFFCFVGNGRSDTLADSVPAMCIPASILHQLPTEGEDAGPSIRGGKREPTRADTQQLTVQAAVRSPAGMWGRPRASHAHSRGHFGFLRMESCGIQQTHHGQQQQQAGTIGHPCKTKVQQQLGYRT